MDEELRHAINREVLAELLKNYFRSTMPEPYASAMCKQVDDAKALCSLLEMLKKDIERGNRGMRQ